MPFYFEKKKKRSCAPPLCKMTKAWWARWEDINLCFSLKQEERDFSFTWVDDISHVWLLLEVEKFNLGWISPLAWVRSLLKILVWVEMEKTHFLGGFKFFGADDGAAVNPTDAANVATRYPSGSWHSSYSRWRFGRRFAARPPPLASTNNFGGKITLQKFSNLFPFPK